MLAKIQSFFQEHLAPEAAGEDGAHRRNLAAAALLIEVARADFDFDEAEQATIEAALRDSLDVTDEEIAELVRLAHEESRDATSLHQFTRLVHETHSLEEKKALMQQLWRVAWADGRIDRYEEQILRRVADLIHLRHGEFIQAKHAAEPDD